MSEHADASRLDLARIARALWSDEGPRERMAFHRAACGDPAGFEAALFRHAIARAALKSDRGIAYDFFQDLCLRHVSDGRAAFVDRSGASARTLTFAELAARTRGLRAAWHRAGVKTGQAVAIVHDMGADYAVAVLTALRMGLVACPVSPHGERYVRRSLEALAPDHVYACDVAEAWLGPYADCSLSRAPSGETYDVLGADSSVYAAADSVLRVCSPFDAEARTPVSLSAHELFIGALRDALLVLDAAPGRAVAWPGCDTELSQPSLLFACWIAGATFVHLTLERLAAEPHALAASKLDLLGVTSALRDLVLGDRLPVPKLRGWLRDPAEPFSWEPWDAFAQLVALEGARGGAALFITAAAGAVFFSPKSARPHLLAVLPTAGRAFALTEVLASGVPTDATSGIYEPTGWEDPVLRIGHFLLSEERGHYLFAGALNGRPDGRPYPAADAVATATEAGLVEAGGVVVRPTPGQLNDAYAVFLGFVDPGLGAAPTAAELEARSERVVGALRLALGEAGVPRRAPLFLLDPRRAEGAVDARWCASQWTQGLLQRKAHHPAFRALSALRRIVAVTAGAT